MSPDPSYEPNVPTQVPPKKPGLFRRFFGTLWRWLDTSRRFAMNMVFLFIVLIVLLMIVIPSGPSISSKTALIMDLKGPMVEQRAGNARDEAVAQLQGTEISQVQLRDFTAALDAAAKDSRIDRVVLMMDEFNGSGLAVLREAAAAIEQFKASGKQVIAWGSGYDQRSYYLAAHASEVYMHPMGMVYIEGYGRYRNYYKDAFDRIGVTANVIRVGTYKNAAEPYFTNAPSAATLESEAYLYNDLWKTYTTGVEKARKLPAGAISSGIEKLPETFATLKGDAGKLAVQAKLVDGLKTRDEFVAMMIERGAKDPITKSFRQINLSGYLPTVKRKKSGDAVGVIIAAGEIGDGDAAPGSIGGRSTSKLIRKAREDDDIKAVVLRVDSPGGSAFGSELIRRELELTRAAGKPVIVSMGNVAASGGYWIAMSADEVIADPATITGSIGVFGILPTADKAMQNISINTGGTHTTWLAGAYDVRRAMDPRFAAVVQSAIDRIYIDFTTKAAAARKTTPEKINEVAQGRVWTGQQAKDRSLIDRVGSYGDALKSAIAKAKLPETAAIRYIERDPSKLRMLLEALGGAHVMDGLNAAIMGAANSTMQSLGLQVITAGPAATAVQQAQAELAWLNQLTQPQPGSGLPFVAVTHCLCGK